MLFRLQKAIFRFLGDIKWAGILHPFWFIINAVSFRLKGKHYRYLEPLMKPGDIIIRRFEGYVDKWFIPGWWNHAGIFVGGGYGDHDIIHATSDGVIREDLIDFMRTDHMIVLRAPEEYRAQAVELAEKAEGAEYDFAFDFTDSIRFSCTELISYCYPSLITGSKHFGRETVVADDIVNSNRLEVVWDSRIVEV